MKKITPLQKTSYVWSWKRDTIAEEHITGEIGLEYITIGYKNSVLQRQHKQHWLFIPIRHTNYTR